jgi:hypothetical protein
MHIVVESDGEVETIDAVTTPGPSLVNVNVRVAFAELVAESSIKLLKVIDAIGEVCAGVAVACHATVGLGDGDGDGDDVVPDVIVALGD